MQRKLLQKSIVQVFYFLRIETTHNLSKVAAAKKVLSTVYVIDTTCFNECFLFHVITRRHYFS